MTILRSVSSLHWPFFWLGEIFGLPFPLCLSFCSGSSNLRVITVGLLVGLRLRHRFLLVCWVRLGSLMGGASPFPFPFLSPDLVFGYFSAPKVGFSKDFLFFAVPLVMDSFRASVHSVWLRWFLSKEGTLFVSSVDWLSFIFLTSDFFWVAQLWLLFFAPSIGLLCLG